MAPITRRRAAMFVAVPCHVLAVGVAGDLQCPSDALTFVDGPCLPPDIGTLSQDRSHSPSGYGSLAGEAVLELQLLRGELPDLFSVSGQTGAFAHDGQARTAPRYFLASWTAARQGTKVPK